MGFSADRVKSIAFQLAVSGSGIRKGYHCCHADRRDSLGGAFGIRFSDHSRTDSDPTMIRPQPLLFLGALLFATNSHALSADAVAGKSLYPACHVCHNQEMDPPLGPPMWGVQRRYRMGTLDAEEFVASRVAFVKTPALENAKHDEAVQQLGLMPPMPLPDEMLEKIATYILEEQFPPPCAHWWIAVRRAMEKGSPDHARKDRNMLKRYCK